MAAIQYLNRIVTRSGVVNSNQKMLNCWEPGVTKFTAANFYNFEQDNLPLYDLEERTYFNWQKLGYPSLEPHSLHLLVSADAPSELISCNSNIYSGLQDAIDSLPRYISVNTRITVASYGDLGSITLEGITVDPEVSLELYNLNYYDKPGHFLNDPAGSNGLDYFYDAHVTSLVTSVNIPEGLYKDFTSSASLVIGGSRGSAGIANFLLRPDSPGAFSFFGWRPRLTQFEVEPYLASSVAGVLDTRAETSYVAFMTPIPGLGRLGGIANEISRLTVGEVTFSNPRVSTDPQNSFSYSVDAAVDVFEETGDVNLRDDIYTYDPSSFNRSQATSPRLYRNAQNALFGATDTEPKAVKTNLYGNSMQYLKVSNCSGRVFIRGFYLSGVGAGIGINIDSCDSLDLESIAVTRYNDAGICVTNSKVSFTRSLYVYRCYAKGFYTDPPPLGFYEVSSYDRREGSPNKRLSKPWLQNIEALDAPENDKSAGILAINSELYLNDDESFQYNTLLMTDFDITNSIYKPGYHNCKIISRCSTGIKLINSTLRGGQAPFVGANFSTDDTVRYDYLNVEGNANYGIDLIDSNLALKCSLQTFHNTRGIRAKNSDIALETFKIDNNHLYGINLSQSKFTYGIIQLSSAGGERTDFAIPNSLYSTNNTKQYQFIFENNGQHIIANNSTIGPGSVENPKNRYLGRLIFRNAHGANSDLTPLPGVFLQGTRAVFMHTTSLRNGVENNPSIGAHFFGTKNSDITFLGSASALTCLTCNTTTTFSESEKYVGVVVDSNSTVRFRGPTVIYDGAVNVLAQKNSNIIFEPHKLADGSLDLLSFPLTDLGNHTQVELKSHRACLVADRNSNIIMEDLGDGISFAPADTNYSRPPAVDYTRAGFMQFYPNPNADSTTYGAAPYAEALNNRGSSIRMNKSGEQYWWGFDYTGDPDPFTFDEITNGGVCVKAHNNSNVRVRNVNFPCGWWNASSVIYDINDPQGVCGKLFVWNISNNSTLHADFLAVSGLSPEAAGYYGPQSVWTSGTQLAAYAAPSSTPDTSSLSVLDFYGKAPANANWPLPNGTTAIYGFSNHENQGPFRLYVGVDSLANQLYNDGSLGLATQVFAQGYNTSGILSALIDTSAVYGKILRITDEGELEASGFYYCNEFVKIDPNQIMLDRSAANTFANAKNGAMGTSNRAQICTIYEPTLASNGEGKGPDIAHLGSGFRSPNIFDILEET